MAHLALLLFAATAASAAINVEGGQVEGVPEDGLMIYRGIPFAAPPVGDLRWRPPQPVVEWEGVKRTIEFGPACMQPGPTPSVGMSEDCLYLNVWTPATSANERLPVLVWIYGGGFVGGRTSSPHQAGDKLAQRGVVVVSIGYRVGSLGFLAHPGLSEETEHGVSGNYGLLDQIAGLKWIQNNIAQFGGDPSRVTIFGESAGGIAVSMLCASPVAAGLFHGAISQSGGSFGPPRGRFPGENMKLLPAAEEVGVAFATNLGASSIDELRNLSAEQLVAAARGPGGVSWPIIDRWVIPDDQYKLYEAGRYNDTPILVGYNSDEGLSFTSVDTPEAYVEGVRERFGPYADKILEQYPVGEDSIPKTARDLARDAAFGWHTWAWARLQSQQSDSKVFYYYFDQHPDYPAGSEREGQGSPHGMDVAFVFDHLEFSNRQEDPTDQAVSDAMADYWTNFAKYGDPNGEGLPEWPEFSDENPEVMYFHHRPFVGPVPTPDGLAALEEYFAWRRTPEGKAFAGTATGIAAKKPVFGGACKIFPWGAMAEFVRDAMEPYGYDVQVCYNCNAANAPRIVAEARTPPPYRPSDHLPEVLAPRNTPGLGAVDFGAVAVSFLRNAYRGTGLYAADGPRENLRLIANIQDPSYVLAAARADSGITDLSQIREKLWPVRIFSAKWANPPYRRKSK